MEQIQTQLESRIVTIKNNRFYIGKIPATKMLRIDHKLLKILAPVLKLLGSFSNEEGKLGFNFNEGIFENAQSIISDILDTDKSETLISLITELVGYCTLISEGTQKVAVAGNIDAIFSDGAMDMYTLAFEVAKWNKAAPFAMLAAGNRAQTAG